MTGECKKNRKRCEKDEAGKQAAFKAEAKKPLAVKSVRGDMMLNSSIEKIVNSQKPKNWMVSGQNVNVKVHGGKAKARTGSKAIQFRHGSGTLSQIVPLKGEGKSKGLYKLTYYVKGDGNAKKAKLTVENETISRASRSRSNVASHNKPGKNWKKFEKFITIKDNAFATEIKFSWNVNARNSQKSGSIWIDDISLVKQ